jgi:t-SNARE complex subunit (syntaxin)
MSKAKQAKPITSETPTPEALGASFAIEQHNVNGALLNTLKTIISAYTVENKAEFEAMVEGYGTQAKSLYNANTAKVRKSEFKKICDHASTQETRQTLFNIIDNYESVQSLVKDLRG